MNSHDLVCECQFCQQEPDYWIGARWNARRKIINDKLNSHKKVLDFLGIKYELMNNHVVISGDEIVPILIDDDRCEEFIAKLKNKAFW